MSSYNLIMRLFGNRFLNLEIIVLVFAIILVGFIALSTAGSGSFLLKQIVFCIAAVLLVVVLDRFLRLDFFDHYSAVIYFFNLGLLFILKIFGSTVLGSQRWLKLGPINIQPSEIAKACLIITLAAWLSRHPIKNYLDILKAIGIVSIPALMVVIQPDLGTTLVYIAICFGMLFWAGAKLIELLVLISPLITAILSAVGHKIISYKSGLLQFTVTVPVIVFLVLLFIILVMYYRAWYSPLISAGIIGLIGFNGIVMMFRAVAWGLLKDYQQKRLTIFLDPSVDPLGAGYHIIQSLYAIGSGGFFGKGLKNGELTQGNFVPEQHTDFIFSAIGEELGFIGAAVTVFLYTLLCLKIISKAKLARDKFGSLVVIGTFSMLFFHIFVNIGMNLSLMPITGVPLPFLSYGGSSLLVNLFLISLVLKTETYDQRYN